MSNDYTIAVLQQWLGNTYIWVKIILAEMMKKPMVQSCCSSQGYRRHAKFCALAKKTHACIVRYC